MKTRRSTTILVAVWVVTFVLYVFVKPTTPEHQGYSPFTNTITKSVISGGPDR